MNIRMKPARALMGLVLLGCGAAAAQTFVFTVVHPPNASQSFGYGVNNVGTVVGVFRTVDNNLHGFVKQGPTYTQIDYPGAAGTSVGGVNDAGVMAGHYTLVPNGVGYGFRLANGSFASIQYPGSAKTIPQGINNLGEIVGYFGIGANDSNRGFRYSNGVYTTIDYPGAIETYATGINDAGDVVGAAVVNGAIRGFLLRNGQFSLFDTPGSTSTFPGGINNLGNITGVTAQSGVSNGFLFRPGLGYTSINYPNSGETGAWSLANNGAITGYFRDSGLAKGFLAIPESLDLTPPVIVPTLTGTLGANGWYTNNVAVSWTTTDPESGIASSAGCASQTVTAGTMLTCTATNGAGLSAAVQVTVKIDKSGPTIAGMPGAACSLWPPNHKMVQVATVSASDVGSGIAPGTFTVTGTSNEPASPGELDIIITANGSGGFVVQLRAERLGTGTGRTYTLTATAKDLAGNTVTLTSSCRVPHDQGQ